MKYSVSGEHPACVYMFKPLQERQSQSKFVAITIPHNSLT